MSTTRVAAPGDTADALRRGPARAPRRGGTAKHGRATPWLFLAPYLVLFAVFSVRGVGRRVDRAR